MSFILNTRLKQLDQDAAQGLILGSSLNGMEKENLRVSMQATLAQTPHPVVLGSSFTHPYITTDYAESLLEVVTPPINQSKQLLLWLENTYRSVYRRLDHELLWASSMPCRINSPDEVLIAQYGRSHLGHLQTLYRKGLGHRYGKKMQTIAGIHFNYSLPTAFWQIWHDRYAPPAADLQTTTDAAYFSLLRNFLRYGWLIDYLFGASTAIDRSFLSGKTLPLLQPYKQDTYYAPYACSLRMSDLGYHNATQKQLHISLNSLPAYLNDLKQAINTPYLAYQTIFEQAGLDAQINANLLQTEAEYYAPVRPKRIALPGERQIQALQRAGVEYLEVRTFDINPYEPLGVKLFQLYFTEIFLLYCLFIDSAPLDEAGHQSALANIQTVVIMGRKPGCELKDPYTQKNILLRDWARALFQDLYQVADFLDAQTADRRYHRALSYFAPQLDQPELLPSAQMLNDLLQNYDSFSELGLALSLKTRDHFLQQAPTPEQEAEFTHLAQQSLAEQAAIEAQQTGSFQAFMNDYFKSGDNS